MNKSYSHTPKISKALLGLLLFFLVVEVGLHFINIEPFCVRYGWNSITTMDSVDFANQFGFRGKRIKKRSYPNEKIVLLLGDSQVESNGLPWQFMMENLLENKLHALDTSHRYSCYTLGSGGFGQDQQLLVLRQYFKYFPADYVLLWFTPENDIWNNTFSTHWPKNGLLKPTFWLENDSLKGPNFEYGEYYMPKQSPIYIYNKIQDVRYAEKDWDNDWESKLPKSSIRAIHTIKPAELYEKAGNDEDFENEKSHYSMLFAERTTRLEYGLHLTQKLLEEINALTTKNNAQYLSFSVKNQWIHDMPDSLFYVEKDSKYFAMDKKMYYKNLSDIMDGFKFKYITLCSSPLALSSQDKNHFNQISQTEIADSVAHWLLKFNR